MSERWNADEDCSFGQEGGNLGQRVCEWEVDRKILGDSQLEKGVIWT